MTDCKCIERATGKSRPAGVEAHTLGCLLATPDLHVVRSEDNQIRADLRRRREAEDATTKPTETEPRETEETEDV